MTSDGYKTYKVVPTARTIGLKLPGQYHPHLPVFVKRIYSGAAQKEPNTGRQGPLCKSMSTSCLAFCNGLSGVCKPQQRSSLIRSSRSVPILTAVGKALR